MSRIRIVKGTYTKITHGEHNMYSNESIITTAGNKITEIGVNKGVSYGSPRFAPAPEINSKCVVHFRAKDGWKGEDYGFDWMRLGETSSFGDANYEDIVTKQYTDSTFTVLEKDINAYNGSFKKSPPLYAKLRKIYGVYDIPWRKKADGSPQNYFCSWLSLYPHHRLRIKKQKN